MNPDALLDPSALEEAGIRCVLFDVGRFALFFGVLRMVFPVRRVSRRVGILGCALVAPICGRDRRHATGHVIFLCGVKRSTLGPNAASHQKLFYLWLFDCWNLIGRHDFAPIAGWHYVNLC